MSERKEVKLGDCIDIIGGGTPKTNNPDYWNGSIPWLSVADLNSDDIYIGADSIEANTGLLLKKGRYIQIGPNPPDRETHIACHNQYGIWSKVFHIRWEKIYVHDVFSYFCQQA